MIRDLPRPRAEWLGVVVLMLAAGCQRAAPQAQAGPEAEPLARIDAAINSAREFLVTRQSPDGAWRSDVYGAFKAGDALTPLVLVTLAELPDPPGETIERGENWLARLVVDGRVRPPESGLIYPLYTAALAAQFHARRGVSGSAARDAWLAWLTEHQLNAANGWSAGDPLFGGWGYSGDVPRKPAAETPLAPLAEPNLSATLYALDALRHAGVPADDPRLQHALAFVRRCQNFGDSADAANDGGFFFMLGDGVRNKAGATQADPQGAIRFSSYGSATADGLRALLVAGTRHDDPRVQSAWKWLWRNFDAGVHPGAYSPDRETARQAVYFYYCQSLAQALARDRASAQAAEIDVAFLAKAIAADLVARQQADGSWSNTAVDVREDDPIVATCLALQALVAYRQLLAAE